MVERVGFPGVSIENRYNYRDDLPGLKIVEVTPKDIREGDIDGKRIADANESAIALALKRVFDQVDLNKGMIDNKKVYTSYTLHARLEVNGNYRGHPFTMMYYYYEDHNRWVLSFREPLKPVYNEEGTEYKYVDHKGRHKGYISNNKESR